METTVSKMGLRGLRLTGIDQIKRHQATPSYTTKLTTPRLNVPTLLSNDIMRKYTNFWSVEEMEEEFKLQYGVPLTNMVLETEIFNKFIQDNSIFNGWRDMLTKAGEMNMSRLVRRAMVL